MKVIKKMMAMVMVMLSVCMCMTSCSSDDDDQPQAGAAKSIEGTYTGAMTCSVMGQESTDEGMTFVLKATDDATMDITLPGFGESPMQVPSIVITALKVTGADGTYTIASKEFSGTTEAGKAYSGTISGSFADNKLTVKYNLKYGSMPVPMICGFTASKK